MTIFKHLFVFGRPASGKSEFLDFMRHCDATRRAQEFHIGHMTELDDFVLLWEKFEEDNLWEKAAGKRFHSKRSDHAYALEDASLYDFVLLKINDIVCKTYLDDESFYHDNSLLIEFSRGGEKPYLPAIELFDKRVLNDAAILYIDVPPEESVRRNEARYQEKLKHSVLAHKCPDEDMNRFYKYDDWKEMTDRNASGSISIKGVDIPFVTMNNEPESKDNDVLAGRYENALRTLWSLKSGS